MGKSYCPSSLSTAGNFQDVGNVYWRKCNCSVCLCYKLGSGVNIEGY